MAAECPKPTEAWAKGHECKLPSSHLGPHRDGPVYWPDPMQIMDGYNAKNSEEAAEVLEGVRALQAMPVVELAKLMRTLVEGASAYSARTYIIGQYTALSPWLTPELLERNGERPSEFTNRMAYELDQTKALLKKILNAEDMRGELRPAAFPKGELTNTLLLDGMVWLDDAEYDRVQALFEKETPS